MNASILEIQRDQPRMKGAYDFALAFYNEYVVDRGEVIDYGWVTAIEAIGDQRAIPLLKSQFPKYERKSDLGDAIGTLMFERRP